MSDNVNELLVVVEQKDVSKVKKLLKSGKTKVTKMLTSFDNYGTSPLTSAIKNNQEDILEMLLNAFRDTKTDINIKDKNGYTALHQAVAANDQILMRLLQHEGINVDVCNDDKNTPLHYFCQNFRSPNCQDPFQIFLSKHVSVNAQNKNGETPLHKAIFNNSIRLLMVNQLLEAHADVNLLTFNQESPLHYAVYLGRADLVNVLLKAGADVTVVGTSKKKRPYELAVQEGHKEMANSIKKYEDLFAWLQEHGLEQYKKNFVQEEMFIDVLGDIDETILNKMQITAAGHRLKILKATASLKKQHPATSTTTTSTSTTSTSSTHSHLLDGDLDFRVSDTADYSGLKDSLQQLKHITELNIIEDGEIEYTEKLGAGASGKVYKGLYKGKAIAIKVLKSMSEEKDIEEFKKEFQIMSAIRSKYVVHFYGAVVEPRPSMVMEHCAKGSLYHVMNNDRLDIGWEKLFKFATEMVRGIECLHGWNPQIVHRDLKSLNLLVNDKWEVKVCDFGLSRFNTGSNMETLAKMRGTLAFCAPEIYFNEQFSTKCDVYSIGIILWELVTRVVHSRYERPFSEFSNLHHDYQIIIQTAKKGLRPTMPDCPPKFAQLIKECWDGQPDKRPNCAAILKRLAELEFDFNAHQDLWNKCIKKLPANE
ncbi:hypothetical protein SAMD00019534_020840 [Acytostelium subglobosum LB1]|uniref:hypothetical protein n=1 Tax=Acytostelium subglobosum LB1 TaxID=1410327 RepID=UPI00064488DC|nr:hypothetical protein SAMD00019534_020840 [Acytostelium subglobosum LB1]GAM18909.1 hypothetical protein SAMD00019534_020840 [Acytostelium subglobosum LB1]|eukprot:XP_012758129.1 hypothetical protein SAMD00019534_020840 [Acytostelium subglobosum LB1]